MAIHIYEQHRHPPSQLESDDQESANFSSGWVASNSDGESEGDDLSLTQRTAELGGNFPNTWTVSATPESVSNTDVTDYFGGFTIVAHAPETSDSTSTFSVAVTSAKKEAAPPETFSDSWAARPRDTTIIAANAAVAVIDSEDPEDSWSFDPQIHDYEQHHRGLEGSQVSSTVAIANFTDPKFHNEGPLPPALPSATAQGLRKGSGSSPRSSISFNANPMQSWLPRMAGSDREANPTSRMHSSTSSAAILQPAAPAAAFAPRYLPTSSGRENRGSGYSLGHPVGYASATHYSGISLRQSSMASSSSAAAIMQPQLPPRPAGYARPEEDSASEGGFSDWRPMATYPLQGFPLNTPSLAVRHQADDGGSRVELTRADFDDVGLAWTTV